MAVDPHVIRNENEFFSQHYLEAVLEGDLKQLFARWKKREEDDGVEPPYERLKKLKGAFAKLQQRYSELRLADEDEEEARLEQTRAFHEALLAALGLDDGVRDEAIYLDDDRAIRLLRRFDRDGTPALFVVEHAFVPPAEEGVLSTHALPRSAAPDEEELFDGDLEEALTALFTCSTPPRWILALAGRFVVLAERGRWGQGRYLAVDLSRLYGVSDASSFRAAAALVSREAMLPGEGEPPLHDLLDEASHKHAYGVSKDLKYGVREAVELLGNAWLRRAAKAQQGSAGHSLHADVTAQKLTKECLTFLYRLLFLFYVEARGEELGIAPMRSASYRDGYSLEHLRDLELVELLTPAAREGTFLHESLERLFSLLFHGRRVPQHDLAASDATFELEALRTRLFDTSKTPLLRDVRIDNETMQRVLQLLSLSREGGRGRGRRRERGRMSYARLGINQLGAVYESLLSYTGFFAREDLYELKPKGKSESDLDDFEQAYFAKKSELELYEEDEFVTEPDPLDPDGPRRKRCYPKGSFVYRLAGRDRERSASYYTPEVLTKAVVKHSLDELLKDIREAPPEEPRAAEILALKVCEPAMGSGAFLSEAIAQLADAYLERRQLELGERLSPARLGEESRRVRARIAAHGVYGVDLNETAVDLAKVSLWLNVLGKGLPVPWLDLQLAEGNSLVGCRRQVFDAADVRRKDAKKNRSYLGRVPAFVPLRDPLPEGTVLHFLVPDEAMVAYHADKVAKELAPEATASMKAWHKAFVKKPFTPDETDVLVELTQAADRLWQRVVELRRAARARTLPRLSVWGEGVSDDDQPPPSLEACEAEYQKLLLDKTSPFRRLRLAMDAWCALFVWPIEEAARLPTREAWLRAMRALLVGEEDRTGTQGGLFDEHGSPSRKARQEALALSGVEGKGGQRTLELEVSRRDDAATAKERAKELGVVDVDAVVKAHPWLAVVRGIGQRQHFFHWELQFAEVFADRGGFDLLVGNPPWRSAAWGEDGILSEFHPRIALRRLDASAVADMRPTILNTAERTSQYTREMSEALGAANYLGARQAYPLLTGVRTNLYRNFLCRSWELVRSRTGFVGMVHQPIIFDDPKGADLRRECYRRLRLFASFKNELRLFSDVNNQTDFCFSISGNTKSSIGFLAICNLFHPRTISESLSHDGSGPVPAVKTEEGHWNLRGHRSRLLAIQEGDLAVFAELFESSPDKVAIASARLPSVHSHEMLSALGAFRRHRKLNERRDQWSISTHWNETNARKAGFIKKSIMRPTRITELVLSGPHFHVANPLYKEPREGCRTNRDYDPIDLTSIRDLFIPRTLYVPSCDEPRFRAQSPSCASGNFLDLFRHVHREHAPNTRERSLMPAIMPPGPSHINAVVSVVFRDIRTLPIFSGLASSLPVDFFVRSLASDHINADAIGLLPDPMSFKECAPILVRSLRLNCITREYTPLWSTCFNEGLALDSFTKPDPRLSSWEHLGQQWTWHTPLRTPYERRQALVELDALAALALGITADELCTVYRVQFPVLYQYEKETFYDQRGHIVFTVNRGLSDVGLKRDAFEQVRRAQAVEELTDDVRALGYVPPFDRCDREADMRLAYEVFEARARGSGKVVA